MGGQGPVHLWSLVGGLVSENPQRSRLIDSLGLPVEFLSSSGPSILPLTLLYASPSHRQCLAVGLCISFSQLLDEASQKTVMLGSSLQYNKVSLIVPGIGACPLDGSQVGPDIDCQVPQSLLYLPSLHFL